MSITKVTNGNGITLKLIFILYSLTLIACSDSDINIPGNHGVGLNQTLVAIYTPTNGSVVPANKPFILDYEVLQAIKSSYVKIQINNATPVTIAKNKGKHQVNGLPEGSHVIQVTEYRSDEKPSGSFARINIIAK